MFYEDWQADIFVTLVDCWVLGGLHPNINWVPWIPVDHDPPPPAVIDILKKHPGLVKPISQSKFGQRKLQEAGIDAWYIPNDFKTSLFKPNAEWRKVGRQRYKWEDKFVIGTVATNHTERKNYTAAFQALALFEKRHPDEVVFYAHTNPHDPRGIDLIALRDNLGLKGKVFFPGMAQVAIGIDMQTMARAYNAFDVFLLPTKGEGFCRPIVEAQACGIPVITTKCTSHEELLPPKHELFIKDLIPQWTMQSSWQFDCRPEEIVELLEKVYQMKKNGLIKSIKQDARRTALQYDEAQVYPQYWTPALEKLSGLIKEGRSLEGVQPWRLLFIPETCIPRKVLDIGCGVTSPYRSELEHLGEYVGVDIKDGHQVVKADAHNLPFAEGEFGFVWMSEVLEHLDNPKQALAEAKRVGKHGVCLFSTPQNQYFKGDPSHRIVEGIEYTTTKGGDGLLVW